MASGDRDSGESIVRNGTPIRLARKARAMHQTQARHIRVGTIPEDFAASYFAED